MAARSLTDRVEIVEQKVGHLELLPDRVAAVESQILQLRSELKVEFSAIRERDEETRNQMRLLHEDVLTRLQETQGQMRVLHEDVVARISLLGEGRRKRR